MPVVVVLASSSVLYYFPCLYPCSWCRLHVSRQPIFDVPLRAVANILFILSFASKCCVSGSLRTP